MIRAILVGGLLLSTTVLASAQTIYLNCGAPTAELGFNTGVEQISSITLQYDPSSHVWDVFHYFFDGSSVARATQYNMIDSSNSLKTEWWGNYNDNPNLYMIGTVSKASNGWRYYVEGV